MQSSPLSNHPSPLLNHTLTPSLTHSSTPLSVVLCFQSICFALSHLFRSSSRPSRSPLLSLWACGSGRLPDPLGILPCLPACPAARPPAYAARSDRISSAEERTGEERHASDPSARRSPRVLKLANCHYANAAQCSPQRRERQQTDRKKREKEREREREREREGGMGERQGEVRGGCLGCVSGGRV